MSVLIKGMEMPTEGTVIAIYKLNGQFYASVHGTELCPIMPVPPHGDLIEREAAYDKIAEQEGGNYVDMDSVGMGLNETPTIIPAEEDK